MNTGTFTVTFNTYYHNLKMERGRWDFQNKHSSKITNTTSPETMTPTPGALNYPITSFKDNSINYTRPDNACCWLWEGGVSPPKKLTPLPWVKTTSQVKTCSPPQRETPWTRAPSRWPRCISRASQAFGRLHTQIWKERTITIKTSISVYCAVVLPSLLYGCETWVCYSRHKRKCWINSICDAFVKFSASAGWTRWQTRRSFVGLRPLA